jgi:DNA-binding XRE family transcriptional regulator
VGAALRDSLEGQDQPLESVVPGSEIRRGRKIRRRGPSVRRAVRRHVAELRRGKDMTQAELARAAGVSRDTVKRIECGHGWPCYESVRRLSRALGVTTELLEKLLDLPIEGRDRRRPA